MIDILYTALTAGSTSALSTLLTCWIMLHLRRRDEEHRRKTEAELISAREKKWQDLEGKVNTLSGKLEEHISKDQSQKILTILEQQGSILSLISVKVDRALLRNEAQDESIKNVLNLSGNLRDDLQKHKEYCQKVTRK